MTISLPELVVLVPSSPPPDGGSGGGGFTVIGAHTSPSSLVVPLRVSNDGPPSLSFVDGPAAQSGGIGDAGNPVLGGGGRTIWTGQKDA